MKELKVEVVEVKERCGAKHKVGDIFFIRGEGTVSYTHLTLPTILLV